MVSFVTNKMFCTLCSCWSLEFTIALMLLITFIYMLQEVETTAVCVEIIIFVASHDHSCLTAHIGVVSSLACWIVSESLYQVY